jgi:NAD(P)H-hydrate repair Nnr-like enzyme with NAD(P)H-hydrate dehydratase domain
VPPEPAGCAAAFLCWARLHARKHPEEQLGLSPLLLGAYGGSVVMRAASQLAFEEKGRSMLAGDIIPHLRQGFAAHFD